MKFPVCILINSFLFLLTAYSQTNWFTTGQNADLMLSGVGFNNTGGPLLFNHPSGLATDGTRLLLCDRFNNRVLIWNTLPTKWDDLPNHVLGQPDFSSNNSGESKSNLNFPGNVSISSNGLVAVADTENDRILIWKTFPTINAQPADISISLKLLSDYSQGQQYEWPWGVWTDGTKLMAVATMGAKIFFWNTIPTVDNQIFNFSIKLPQMGTPRNISTDGTTYLFVGDHNAMINNQNKSGTFFWNSYPTQTDKPYDWFFDDWIKGIKTQDGKLVAGGSNSVYIWNTFPTSSSISPIITIRNQYYLNGDGPDVVYAGGKLYVNNYNGNNIQVYNNFPTSSNQQPDFAIGSPSVTMNTLRTINHIQNPVVASDGKVIIATSDFDACLMLWKTVNPSSGQAPDVKIDFRPIQLAIWDNELFNNKLIGAGKKTVAIWNSLPLNGEMPDKVFYNSVGSVQFQELMGAALDARFFYLGEKSGKIYLWKTIPSIGNENPDRTILIPKGQLNRLHSDGEYLCATLQDGPTIYIFRVSDLEKGNLNPWKEVIRDYTKPNPLPLNLPSHAITFNGKFAIANTVNNSVYLWNNVEDAGDVNKVIVLGQQSISGINPGLGQNRLFWPASLAMYRNHLWVGEFKFSSRILSFSYSDPTEINEVESIPAEFMLYQNYPNPFHSATTIQYQLPEATDISIKIYNMTGKEVYTLVKDSEPSGIHEIIWDGRNYSGQQLPGGVYFCTISTNKFFRPMKMILMR